MVMIQRFFSNPFLVFGLIFDISLLALIGALVGQFVFDLPPCNLCIWQRGPYVLTALFGLTGLFWASGRPALLIANSIAFFSNSVLAFYHSGIELGWWQESNGCAANFDLNSGSQGIMEQIMSAQTSSCAEIPWVDPIFGLSMANYNIMLCFAMSVFCLVALRHQLQDCDNGKGDTAVK